MNTNHEELRLSDDEIKNIIAPFIHEAMPVESEVWKALEKGVSSDQVRRLLRRKLLGSWIHGFRRTQKGIKESYSRQWQNQYFEDQLNTDGPLVPLRWCDTGYKARAIAAKRVYLAYIARVIRQFMPGKVIEVGAGNGLNLLLLAAHFPAIDFTGAELTEGGVKVSREAQSADVLSAALQDFSPFDVLDASAHKRIKFDLGNATCLGYEDNAFDLCFTALALEQMEEVRRPAIEEIARITGNIVVMVEPFRDWNNEGAYRNYIRANDYFQGAIADLDEHGLEVLFASADMPHKLTLWPGIVVARVK